MRTWRVALRIARRDALRARARSLLVVAMIALPVLGVTAVDVLVRTYQLSPAQAASRDLGAADAAVSDSGQASVEQDGSGQWSGGGQQRDPVDPAAALPSGSRTLADRQTGGSVSVPGRVVRSTLRALAYTDPLARGVYRQVDGRAPAATGEVALTTALRDRLGVRPGDRVELAGVGSAVVVGTVEDRRSFANTTALVAPGAALAQADTRLLVDLPRPLTWDLVRQLNARGVVVTTRGEQVPGQPPPPSYAGDRAQTAFAVSLVVGMALLEVVLLAGPAFAVGARRQEHVLALMSVAGARRRDLRRTVLGGGLVLGVAGGVVGVLAGVALAAAVLPLLPRLTSAVPGPFEVPAAQVLGIAVLGVGTALAAALLPAWRASRQDVLAALTGRRGVRRIGLRLPLAGLGATAAGALLALHGARGRQVDVVLAGAMLAELGLVATTPAVVGLAGRLGPLLPAAPRLALRDAARNRARTAPAVAAILAAVAGSVAVGTYVSSLDREDARTYRPEAALGAVTVHLDATAATRVDDVSRVLSRELPGARLAVLRRLDPGSDDAPYPELVHPPARQCPVGAQRHDPRCAQEPYTGGPVVGGADVLAVLDDVPVVDLPRLTAALDRGAVAVPGDYLDEQRRVRFVLHGPTGDDRTVLLPGVALPAQARPQPVMSPAAAAALVPSTPVSAVLALPGAVPSRADEDRLRAAVQGAGVDAGQLGVERGYVGGYGIGLLALLGGSALLVLGASGVATGLAAADGRADLATLAAVGASPALRRMLAAWQSVVTAGLGSLLGVAAGLVPAVALIRAINAPDATGYRRPVPFPTVVPWGSIAVSALVVPLLAGLVAALLTRSRLPMVRRVA